MGRCIILRIILRINNNNNNTNISILILILILMDMGIWRRVNRGQSRRCRWGMCL